MFLFQAKEHLETFITRMVHKAQHLGTTRESQMMRKKQILDELQKVGNLLLDSVPRASAKQSSHWPSAGASVSTLTGAALFPRVSTRDNTTASAAATPCVRIALLVLSVVDTVRRNALCML